MDDRDARSWRAGLLEAVVVLALFLVATLIRAPMLMEAPSFTDETIEVLYGLAIYRGEILPLTNADAYYGPLWGYLLAGGFWLVGPSPTLPRGIVLLTGSATVVATYLLGRQVAGPWAGLLAAGLLLTAPWQILIHSHVAWSHALTPLLTTAALLLQLRALDRGNGWLLVSAGFLLGLAIQSHPTAVALLPGVALAALLHPRGRRWLYRPWPYCAALTAVIAYSPVIADNLLHPGASFGEGRERTYAVADLESHRYLTTLVYLPVRMLHDLVGIAVGPIQEIHHLPWPSDWSAAPLGVLAVASVVHGFRARRWLPLLSAASVVLLVPLMSYEYNGGRYVAPAWPPLYVLIGGLLAMMGNRLGTLLGSQETQKPATVRRAMLISTTLVGLVGLFLAGRTLPRLNEYYADAITRGETAGPLISLVERAIAIRDQSLPVLLDERLVTYGASYAGASSLAVAEYVLATSGVPLGLLVANPMTAEWLSATPRPAILVLTPETRDHLVTEYNLTLERVSDDVAVRVPVGPIVRNFPSRQIPPGVDTPRTLALYRVPPSGAPSRRDPVETSRPVVAGRLAEGWDVVGWRSSLDVRPDVPAPDGSASLALKFDGPYGGQLLHGPTFSTRGYHRLDFDVHGGTASNQPLRVSLRDADGENILQVAVDGYTEWGGIGAGAWRRVSLPLEALNAVDREARGIQFLMGRRDPTPTLYVANVRFTAHRTQANLHKFEVAKRLTARLPGYLGE